MTDTEHVYVIKQLSVSNSEFERLSCEYALGCFGEEFEIQVRDMPSGRNNKNRNSGMTLVVVFAAEPSCDLVAQMRWAVHVRFH